MSFEIQLTPWQSDFIQHPARFKVAVCGRRSGKTTMDAIHIYLFALQNPGCNIWFVADTHQQAHDLMWKWLVDGIETIDRKTHRVVNQPPLFDSKIIKERCNRMGALSVTLTNGSTIEVKGSSNADALLGASLDLLILDEYQSQNPEVFWKLMPMLSDRQGKLVITGTPRGYNHLYDAYFMGAKDNPERDPDWHSVQVNAYTAGIIAPDELERAKRSMSAKQFVQEYMAGFNSPEGMVYSEFDADVHIRSDLSSTPILQSGAVDRDAPVLIGWDFNVGLMATVHAVKAKGEIQVFDELCLKDTNTRQMCEALLAMYPGRRIIAHPDPSGCARDTTGYRVGENDFSIIRSYGIEVVPPPPQNFPGAIESRINTVNWLFRDMKGTSKMYVSDRCTYLLRSLRGQVYNEKTGQPVKDNKIDGPVDALGYLALVQYPRQGNFHVGKTPF